jgi:hypothetical protein
MGELSYPLGETDNLSFLPYHGTLAQILEWGTGTSRRIRCRRDISYHSPKAPTRDLDGPRSMIRLVARQGSRINEQSYAAQGSRLPSDEPASFLRSDSNRPSDSAVRACFKRSGGTDECTLSGRPQPNRVRRAHRTSKRSMRRASSSGADFAGRRRGAPGDEAIAANVGVGASTVYRTKRRFVPGNLQAALSEEPGPGASRKLSGKDEAHLIATACSSPPDAGVVANEMVRITVRADFSRARRCAAGRAERVGPESGIVGRLHGPRVWSKVDLTVHRLRRKAHSDQAVVGFAEYGWGTRIRT